MPHVVAAVDVAAPAADTWDGITDWPAHSRFVPLTRVDWVGPPVHGVGGRFVGRTGVGPLAFDDPMEVVEWQPPADGAAGHCLVRKQGRVVLGTARIDVAPLPGGRSRLTWTYDVDLAPVAVTRRLGPLVRVFTKAGLTRVLSAVARDVERRTAGRGSA